MSSQFISSLEQTIFEGISEGNQEDDIKKLCMITSGLNDIEILKSVMFNYLKKIQEETENILKIKNHYRAERLATDIKQFLTMCYLRHKRIKDDRRENQLNFGDILASLLSIYIDLHSVMSFEDKNKTGSKLCSFILFITEECPDCRLGMLLDLCNATEEFVDVLLPTVRKCLVLNREEITEEQYLKYILVIKTMMKKLGDSLDEEKKAARRVTAPTHFIDWVTSHKKETEEELSIMHKMPPSKLTAFLLDEASEELIDLLQEILIALSSSKVIDFESKTRSSDMNQNEGPRVFEVSDSHMESEKKTSSQSNFDGKSLEATLVEEVNAGEEQKEDEPYFFVDKFGSDMLKIPHDSLESKAYSENDDDEVLDESEEHAQHKEECLISDSSDVEITDPQEAEIFRPFFLDRGGPHSPKNMETSVEDDKKIKNGKPDRNESLQSDKKKKRKTTVILPSPEAQKSKTAKTRSMESSSYCLRSKKKLKRKKFSAVM